MSLAFLVGLAGCATSPQNPSFPVTRAQAHTAIEEMAKDSRPLPRPLVVVGGYMDPFLTDTALNWCFEKSVPRAKIISISLFWDKNLAACRAHILAMVNEQCGNHDPNWTAEVDVVGISMGGLAARLAAAPSPDPAHPQRLRIAHLFTLSSPLSGAKLAQYGITDLQHELQPHSSVQDYLAATDPAPAYAIISYVHLDDEVVGPEYAALPGRTPYWLPNTPFLILPAHLQILHDVRVYADIVRRLRGDTPFTLPDPAPLPKADDQPALWRGPSAVRH